MDKNRRYIFITYENFLEHENREIENFREIKVSRLSDHPHNKTNSTNQSEIFYFGVTGP